jgi:hypothetical protein
MLTYPVGLGQLGDLPMNNYSIVRVGNEYVVQVDEKSVLKIASRRRAARLVTDAAGLLQSQPTPLAAPQSDVEPSLGRDPEGDADPEVTVDPQGRT